MRFASIGCAAVLLIASTTGHSTEIIARGYVIRGKRPDLQHRMPFDVGDKIELRYRLGEIDRNYGIHDCRDDGDSTCQRTRIAVEDISGRTFGNPNGHAEFYMRRLPVKSGRGWGFPHTLQMKTANKETGDWFYLNLLDSARMRARYLDPDGAVLSSDMDLPYSYVLSIPESADWLSGFDLIDLPTTTTWSIPQDHGRWMLTELQVIHDLSPGDADGDGLFDQRDLVQVLGAGRYLTGRRASWSQGDWNADGVFNQADIGAVLRQFPAADRFAVVSVPEPSAIVLVLAVFAIHALRRVSYG